MDKKTKKIIGAFSLILVLAALIFGTFLAIGGGLTLPFVANKNLSKTDEKTILLEKDLENAYPETPTEVVKLYWRFNKYMYNKKVSDKDLENLMKQLRLLYDDELLSEEKNSYETMLETFQKDKKNRGDETIVSTVVEKYDTVKVEKGKDKKKYATVIVAVHSKKSGKSSTFFESFMCRADAKKHWKILGWKSATQQEAIDAGVQ